MEKEPCKDCLFSKERTSIVTDGLLYKCKHENSPYYDEYVSENGTCRLFVDAYKYFKIKDRKIAIKELKNNINK